MADGNTRAPRTLATREKEQRRWMPPSSMPEPEPQDGYSFRWVRVSMAGENDAKSISSRLREGFVPVRAEDHPELKIHAVTEGQFIGGIESGGLLLCKIPTEFVKQRNEYYSGQTRQQVESVDSQLMRENDPRMPLFRERKTKVSFGNG